MFFKEFKKFIARGNVIDLAVAVIIGAAFNSIVQSLVKDVLMPVFGLVMGRVNLSKLQFVFSSGVEGGEIVVRYGAFLQATLDFLILALCVFSLVKFINVYKAKEEEPEKKSPPAPKDIELLSEIRDLLKNKQP